MKALSHMIQKQVHLQSNLNGSNIFGTMELFLDMGESLRVIHSARLGDKRE